MIKNRLFGYITIILITLSCVSELIAQEKTVSGIVKDIYGENLPGVSIIIKGSKNGTITDAYGNYSIKTSDNSTLLFSYIGFNTYEIPVGNKVIINVELTEKSLELKEVVVTALGIQRDEKALGYSTQKIQGDNITNAISSNWSAALSGKVAGLNVTGVGGPIGSTRITLRGDVSLNQNGNNALIVIDGVPLSSNITNTGVAFGAGGSEDMSIDYGNGFADINPDDIDNIQILKGAGATALYGTRAANGVIMVTTKSGNAANKGLGVTFSSNMSIENILKWPDYQYEFGQGLPTYIGKDGTEYEGKQYYSYGTATDGNNSTGGTSSAYGPRFNPNQLYFQYDPVTQKRAINATPWIPYKDNRKDLFQNGFTLTNNIAISGKNSKGSMRLSLSQSKNEWILPNTGFERITISFSGDQQISNRIKIALKTSYTNRNIDNTPGVGYNSNTIAYFLISTSPNINTNWLKPMWEKGLENVQQLQPFSPYIGNPFLNLYESTNSSLKQSFVSSATATLNISKKMNLQLRSALNASDDEREQHRPVSDAVYGLGYFQRQQIGNYELNSDILLNYSTSYKKLNIKSSVGANIMKQHYNLISASIIGLGSPGEYKLINGISAPYVTLKIDNKAIYSVYSVVNFTWDNKIFIDLSGRNDWSSTLPKENRSFFYPSVNTSFMMHELMQLPKAIDFLKIRASLAEVGNDTEPYKTARYYSQGTFPGSATTPTTLHNANFKPEISMNIETGTDIRMFKNRIGIDFSFYYNQTRNQIIDIPMDPTSGYLRATINAGIVRNRGYELMFNASPVVIKDFSWKSTIIWSKNENKILELADGFTDNQVIGGIGSASIIGSVGGTTGDIWGYKLVRNENGDIVIAPNGLPERSAQIEYIGSAYPAWKGGFNNEFSHKNLKFSFLIDGQMGGIVYSHSYSKSMEQGKLTNSLNGRIEGTQFYMPANDARITNAGFIPFGGVYMIAPGVILNSDGTYKPNDKVVTVEEYYRENNRRENVETNSFDASYIKLREARIEFVFPKKMLTKLLFTKITLAFYGRNLLMFTTFPWFDPEISSLNKENITPGIETGQLPSTRTYGISFNLTL